MSTLALAALTALGLLNSSASQVNRHGDTLRFRFRRSSLDALAGVQELLARGIPFKFYTGGHIWTYTIDGTCSHRSTSTVRPYAVVEVTV